MSESHGNMMASATKDGQPTYIENHFTFQTKEEADAFAALFPKSLRVRSSSLSTQKQYHPELEGTGPVKLGYVTFDVKFSPTKGNDANETGANRYRKFMAKLDELGYDVKWRPSPSFKTREEFEAALEGNSSSAPPIPDVDSTPELTEVPSTPEAVKPLLAPLTAIEPESKSVKVAGPKKIPMEFKEAAVADVPKYAADDNYYFQQKVDGVRAQLALEPGKKPWFRSKSGDQLQSTTAAKIYGPLLKKLGEGLPEGSPAVSIDGEMLDGKWYVFDMTVDGTPLPWDQRMAMAEEWVKSLNDQGITSVQALPTARTPEEKMALFEAIRDGGGEGVMIKRKTAKYKYGQRTDEILKAKITTTADVVVMDRNVEGKVNAVVGVYKDGKLTRVANIPMQGKPDAKVGDVIEVEYLWAHGGSGLLTQARMKKIRPDKNPLEASDSQFRFVNKDVIDLPTAGLPEPSDGEFTAEEITQPPTAATVAEVKSWEASDAKAELDALEAEVQHVLKLESLYDQWATNTGIAKHYGGGFDFKSAQASKAYSVYKEAKDAWKAKNDEWIAKHQLEWPDQGIGVDEHWDSLPEGGSTVKTGSVDGVAWEKIRDMYVVKDPQTIMHNASLRSDAPTSAAKTWRGKVSRMVNNQKTVSDALMYRTAAFTPAQAAQLVPGAVIHDPGFTSVGTDENSSYMYAQTRVDQRAGSTAYYFHIQVPKGTPAASVGYGEVVLDYGNSMEVLRVGMVDGRRTIVVRLIPKGSN
jgi:hypothetical protein